MSAPLLLLIDDDPDDEELARIALRRARVEHTLEVKRDGSDALDWLWRRGAYAETAATPPPRVILLDLKLPKIGGLDVLAQIRADARTRLVPVVVFTSSNEERDLFESYRRGANGYVRKPVDFREYKELIADIGAYWMRRNEPPAPAYTRDEG